MHPAGFDFKLYHYLAAVTAVMIGCGGGGSTAPNYEAQRAALAGTWTLQTVDGHVLPDTTTANGGRIIVVSGSLVLNTSIYGNTYVLRTISFGNPPLDYTDQIDLGWGPNADGTVAINLLLGSGPIENTATVSGNRMTVTMTQSFRAGAGVYVYSRP